jgi:hypothetical protein
MRRAWILLHPIDNQKSHDQLMNDPEYRKFFEEGTGFPPAPIIPGEPAANVPPPRQITAQEAQKQIDAAGGPVPAGPPLVLPRNNLPPVPPAPVTVNPNLRHGEKYTPKKQPTAPPAPVKPAPIQREDWETPVRPVPRPGEIPNIFVPHPDAGREATSPKTSSMLPRLDDYRIAGIVSRLSARNQRIVGIEGWRPASDFNHPFLLADKRVGATIMAFLGSAPSVPDSFTTSSPGPVNSQPSTQHQQFSFANTWTGGEP